MRFAKELDDYKKRCIELEEKSKQDEIRCLMLESEVEDLRKKKEELELQITRINGEKGKKGKIVDLTNEEYEEDKYVQLMIENKVLECEKTKAETELKYWKEKAEELVSRVCEMESKSSRKGKDAILIDENRSQVRRRLPFEDDKCPNKNISPSTPGSSLPCSNGVFDFSDEDINHSEIPKIKKLSVCSDAANIQCSPDNNLERTTPKHFDEDDIDGFKGYSRNSKNAKRKRASHVVTSDEETSDDDNALICTLKTRKSSKLKADSDNEVLEDVSKPRLTRLRKSESKNQKDKITCDEDKVINLHGNNLSEDEEGTESEGESLDGFIVHNSESDPDCAYKSGNSCDEYESEPEPEPEDEFNDYKSTLDKISRKKDTKSKWELEGDMLADFGKDSELCMRAVCALYRQQTSDEKFSKETLHPNGRGFSHTDAFRGSKLAEFLTDGDACGDLNKTVEELKRYDTKGSELCHDLATKYSKQLFAIYQNKEDPYFLP